MIPQLVDALQRQEGVHDWLLRRMQKKSTQYYVIGRQTENRRTVHSEEIVVTVMNDHRASKEGQALVRGEAQVTLLPADGPQLKHRLSQAVFMAGLADNPLYGLPGPVSYPRVQLADAEMQKGPGEVAEHLVQQLLETLAQENGVRLSSAEVFIEENEITLQNSRGASGSQVSTSLLLDFVLLATGDMDEMEAQIAFRRRRAADLDVPALARRQAQYARDALRARPPQTGTFPVVVSDEALTELLMSEGYSPLILRSSAQLKYQGLTTWETGKTILTEEPTGDPFTMYANGLLPFGTASGRFDSEGLPGQRTLVVEQGVLSRFWATQRYADYLQIPATGQFGNMEVNPGAAAFEELFAGPGPLYHIVAFSAMSPDPITGNFVGEIRLGYEMHQGQCQPIRGGSISGNLFAALASAQLCQETAFLGDYFGPRAIRFPRITVAGE